MSVATVVTRGFGSFGSVNLLPTFGYSIGDGAQPFASGDWPTIYVPAQSRTVEAGIQSRTITVPRQVRTITDPRMGQ